MGDIEIAKIYRLEGNGAVKAFCDIIVANILLIKGLRIIEGKNGLFVRMPARVGKDGKWYESIAPMSKEIRDNLNEIILTAFKE